MIKGCLYIIRLVSVSLISLIRFNYYFQYNTSVILKVDDYFFTIQAKIRSQQQSMACSNPLLDIFFIALAISTSARREALATHTHEMRLFYTKRFFRLPPRAAKSSLFQDHQLLRRRQQVILLVKRHTGKENMCTCSKPPFLSHSSGASRKERALMAGLCTTYYSGIRIFE